LVSIGILQGEGRMKLGRHTKCLGRINLCYIKRKGKFIPIGFWCENCGFMVQIEAYRFSGSKWKSEVVILSIKNGRLVEVNEAPIIEFWNEFWRYLEAVKKIEEGAGKPIIGNLKLEFHESGELPPLNSVDVLKSAGGNQGKIPTQATIISKPQP